MPTTTDESPSAESIEIPRDDLPSREELMARLSEMEARLAPPPADDPDLPDLIVRRSVAPVIDLTRPEDCPDLPDGEWSKRHLVQFLSRQPRTLVYIPKEAWEPKNEECFQFVGYQGHGFRIRKGQPESVPIQIAAIVEQSQQEFPTSQSQAKKRLLTDIRDLPDLPGKASGLGVEVFLGR